MGIVNSPKLPTWKPKEIKNDSGLENAAVSRLQPAFARNNSAFQASGAKKRGSPNKSSAYGKVGK